MGGTAIRALGLDTSRGRVAQRRGVSSQQRWVQTRRCGAGARRTSIYRLCAKSEGWAIGRSARTRSVDRVDTRGRDGFWEDVLDCLGKRRDVLEDGGFL